MSSPLEKFIQENRDQFDDEMPDPKLWDKIRPESDPEKAYQKPVRFLPFKRWLTVAAALVCIAASGYLYSILHIKKAAVEVVKTTPAMFGVVFLPGRKRSEEKSQKLPLPTSYFLLPTSDLLPPASCFP